jgi:dihydroorotase-like cyclic amidohydrolase
MIPGRVLFIGVLGFAASVGSALGQNRKQSLALVGATVIDGTGALPLRDAVVLIESGRIVAIGSRARTKIPDHFERRELRGVTVLPGLIDSPSELRSSPRTKRSQSGPHY